MNGQDVVAEARSWIGTPYLHQASVKGVGCDCLGLVRGLWRALHGAEPCVVPPYTADWSEASGREDLLLAAARWLTPLPARAPETPGEVLVFRLQERAVAKHIGLLARCGAEATFIHAYSGHAVVESPLSAPWRRRIAGRFRLV